jgi:hypothetical protein
MKREFSFYEFVAILVPSAILLYAAQLILEYTYQKQIVDFGKIGETAIFIIICYGVGHIIQSLGNFYENIIWFVYGGMPAKWLTNKNKFNNYLFEQSLNQRIVEQVKKKFGDDIEDYGRLAYNLLFQKDKTKRIDIFNGNYSLFRGLAVSFLIITALCSYYLTWQPSLIALVSSLLATVRMIRFAKYYATETFRTFYNLSD